MKGDTLAPYLFIIFRDYPHWPALNGNKEELGLHLKKRERESRRIRQQCITDPDFADDMALISELYTTGTEIVEYAAAEIDGQCEETKDQAKNTVCQVETRTIDGSVLEMVEDFVYLGSLFRSSTAEVKKRIPLTRTACNGWEKCGDPALKAN